MKIRKCALLAVLMVALLVVSLPLSFADNMVQSAMTEPVPELEIGDTVNFKQYWICENNSPLFSSTPYFLVEYIGVNVPLKGRYNKTNNPLFVANPKYKDRAYVGIALCDQGVGYGNYITVNVYDLQTGNLLNSQNPATEYGLSYNGYYSFYYNSYLPTSSYIVRGYRLGDLGFLFNDDESYKTFNATPFVQWSTNIPDQIQLKSPLSEPIPDKYNSYAVLDDRLIWISYRINGIYSRSASIENISEVYSYNAQINESGTGIYEGQQNGYTENIEIPTQTISGSYSGSSEDTSILTNGNFDQFGFYRGSVYDEGSGYTNSSLGKLYLDNLYLSGMKFSGNHSGVTSGAIIPGIDFTGVNSGSVRFNSNGSVSLKDIEYYPISFNHNDIFEYYRLFCLPTANNNFVFWLSPDRSFVPLDSTNQLLVNMDFYYSEFDLEGNYIRSEMHTVTETDIGLFDAFQPEEDIHSVKFYGIDFFNIDNLPFNLSSVLWQYDYEFKQWRDNMYTMLNRIYNVLAKGNNVPEPDSRNQWAENLSGSTPQNDLDIKPEGQEVALDNALGNLNFSPQNRDNFEKWAGLFSNGKLIACCIFALACGSVILTLGKKKSE